MAELSEACRKHLAARWDDGMDADEDTRFVNRPNPDAEKVSKGGPTLAVINLDIEDFFDFPELRGYTAVAISQDGSVAYLTKEEAEDDEE